MKLFTGTESYATKPESEDPGFARTLIYYLGNISDQWENFANISYYRIVYNAKITRFGDVKEI